MNDVTAMMWEELENKYGVSEEALHLVTDINGYSEDTMYDILYSVAAENMFSWEYEEEEEEDWDDDEDEE